MTQSDFRVLYGQFGMYLDNWQSQQYRVQSCYQCPESRQWVVVLLRDGHVQTLGQGLTLLDAAEAATVAMEREEVTYLTLLRNASAPAPAPTAKPTLTLADLGL